MSAAPVDDREQCPACGGAGGGPFGRAGSGWDIESYECPCCEGWGYVRKAAEAESVARPGIAKTTPRPQVHEEKKRRTGA